MFIETITSLIETFSKDNYKKKVNGQINAQNHPEQIFLEKLYIQASIKKILRDNDVSYMTKSLRKSIMKRFELETKYIRSKTSENLKFIKSKETFALNCTKKKEENITRN